MGHDNYIDNRGVGAWTFYLYKPDSTTFGPFIGELTVSKDFHSVYTVPDNQGTRECICNFPNQNVAAVINSTFLK
jgi:hypothetical protein